MIDRFSLSVSSSPPACLERCSALSVTWSGRPNGIQLLPTRSLASSLHTICLGLLGVFMISSNRKGHSSRTELSLLQSTEETIVAGRKFRAEGASAILKPSGKLVFSDRLEASARKVIKSVSCVLLRAENIVQEPKVVDSFRIVESNWKGNDNSFNGISVLLRRFATLPYPHRPRCYLTSRNFGCYEAPSVEAFYQIYGVCRALWSGHLLHLSSGTNTGGGGSWYHVHQFSSIWNDNGDPTSNWFYFTSK